MKCRMQNCPGEYEERRILHSERHGDQPLFVDDVPALVCRVCGDTLLSLDTVRHIEELLNSKEQPAKQVPVFVFSQEAA
jgi:YgiT-type zinc finger domain-containing protein